VGVERRPVHRLIACAARPGGVPATVTEASLMTHQHLADAAQHRWHKTALPKWSAGRRRPTALAEIDRWLPDALKVGLGLRISV
jgi:hypothetical protein